MDTSKLRERRRELGLSQEALARLLGVTVKTVARWERGLNEPFPRQRKPLAAMLGVKPSDLFNGKAA